MVFRRISESDDSIAAVLMRYMGHLKHGRKTLGKVLPIGQADIATRTRLDLVVEPIRRERS